MSTPLSPSLSSSTSSQWSCPSTINIHSFIPRSLRYLLLHENEKKKTSSTSLSSSHDENMTRSYPLHGALLFIDMSGNIRSLSLYKWQSVKYILCLHFLCIYNRIYP